MNNKETMLEIKNLSVEYYKRGKPISAVRDVSLNLNKQEILGIVGESGCGKTTLALSILNLILPNEGKITKGEIFFKGHEMWEKGYWKRSKNILNFKDEDMRRIRGKKIGMIFQDPFTSFNPVFTIGDQILESIVLHMQDKITGFNLDIRTEAIGALKKAKISDPERVMDSYPHQLSGGMLQRAMIAMTIVCDPKIMIADEPTTALDVTLQKDILELLRKLQQELAMSLILITHNLAIVAEICDKVAVMYAGEIVEEGPVKKIFCNPCHPYTSGLLGSLLYLKEKRERLTIIPGQIPDLADLPFGCKFYPRCNRASEMCVQDNIELKLVGEGHYARCCRI